jgi:hypothetical protein
VHLLFTLVEDDVAFILNELAVGERSPQGTSNGGLVLQVVRAKDLADLLGSLLSMVEGHLGEQMVAHMRVNDVVEGVIQEGAEGSVDSAESTAQPVPLGAAEMGHVDIRVLKVRDEHQMVVGDHVGDNVVHQHRIESEDADAVHEQVHGHEESDISLNDQPVVAFVEKRRSRAEVAIVLSLVLSGSTIIPCNKNKQQQAKRISSTHLPRCIEHQVSRHPANGQHHENAKHVRNRSLAQHFLAPIGSGARSKHFVVVTTASVVVVLAVGDTPRVVWHEKQRVADGADGVVDKFTIREGLMAAFVRQHPDTSHHGALTVPVNGPQHVRGPQRQGAVSNP